MLLFYCNQYHYNIVFSVFLGGNKMANFKKISVEKDARTELHDKLGLTGAEISVNNLPAGAGVPFVHYHKKNGSEYFLVGFQFS